MTTIFTWSDAAAKAAVAKAINAAAKAGSEKVLADAKNTTAFRDVTGTLRKSIVKKKSIFAGGGWLVKATAPHAHLIEFGCRNGAQAPRPFLRNAKKKNETAVKKMFDVELAKI